MNDENVMDFCRCRAIITEKSDLNENMQNCHLHIQKSPLTTIEKNAKKPLISHCNFLLN